MLYLSIVLQQNDHAGWFDMVLDAIVPSQYLSKNPELYLLFLFRLSDGSVAVGYFREKKSDLILNNA